MVRKILPVLLVSAVAFSFPLFRTSVGGWNPIEAAFLGRYVSVQFDYYQEDLQYLNLSAGISSDVLNAYVLALTGGNFLSGDVDVNSMSFLTAAVANLKLANAIVLGGTVYGTFSMNDGFSLLDGSIPVVLGLGGKGRSAVKRSAGAVYYLTHDLVSVKDGKFEVNEDFDYKDGYVGIYGMSEDLKGSSYIDMGINLRIIDELNGEGEVDILDLLGKYSFFSLTYSSGGLTFGGTWWGSPDGNYYYDLFVGVDFGFLRVWGTTYVSPYNGINNPFEKFFFSAQVSL